MLWGLEPRNSRRRDYQLFEPQVFTPCSLIVRLPSPACGVPVFGVAVRVNVVAVAVAEIE